ncbi:hypothetical protein LZC95_18395 [Pendulispora brunnea]|uniref:Uncharacterized protein n=1 Tax=Pendulispora brunnea TaxID=2905690 RepID=A0ABZ2KJD4_9BACT
MAAIMAGGIAGEYAALIAAVSRCAGRAPSISAAVVGRLCIRIVRSDTETAGGPIG